MIVMLEQLWIVIIASLSPVLELRGGIPIGVGLGLDPLLVIITAVVFNALVFFPVFAALGLLYRRLFERFGWARRIIERIHKKGRPVIERYGVIGLVIFVAVPLPVTGAWTGTIIAWLLGLDWRRSFLAVALGVVIAGAIVSAVVLGGISVLNFFVK
ncbi:MAG: small multi-drug export protein [Candidatus Aenigmarchaeota archaeon]|nr:small multi-drug export protein [Candidatus Aenigmarchaeota archaeon]